MTRFNVASAFMLMGVLGDFVSRRDRWLVVSLPAIVVMLATTLNIRFEVSPQYLAKGGVKPIDVSKSVLGSECP